MAPKINLPVVVALGALGYLIWREVTAPVVTKTTDLAPAGGGLGLPPDPFSAVVNAVAPLLPEFQKDLQDRDSDLRQGTRKLDRARRQVFSEIGIGSDPKKREKKKKQFAANILMHLQSMEAFAQRAHQAMSRKDVVEFVIDTPETKATAGAIGPQGYGAAPGAPKIRKGRISILFTNKSVQTILVPDGWPQEYALAWLAEPVVRVTGGFTQRGGRLPPTWVTYEDVDGVRTAAYSDRNPYAPIDMTIGAINGRARTPEAQASRLSNLRRKLSPAARAKLDQSLAGSEEEAA